MSAAMCSAAQDTYVIFHLVQFITNILNRVNKNSLRNGRISHARLYTLVTENRLFNNCVDSGMHGLARQLQDSEGLIDGRHFRAYHCGIQKLLLCVWPFKFVYQAATLCQGAKAIARDPGRMDATCWRNRQI